MDFRETEEVKARIAKNAAALIDRLAGGRTFVVNLGVGGAMDLVCGAKRVIVAMAHCRENGEKKLVRRSVLPVTGYHEADYIVTQFCMMRYTGSGYEVFALAKGVTPQMLRDITGFDFTVADGCGRMLD